jgi:hypothetical protein
MPNFTISRNLASGLLLRQSGAYVRALANKPLSSVGDGMRFPRLVQNLYLNSEPNSGGSGVTYTAGNLGQFQVDNFMTLSGGGVGRNRYDVASAPANNSLGTVAFLCERIAGGEPAVNLAGIDSDVQAGWGGGGFADPNEVFKEQYGNIWFVRVKLTALPSANTNTGIRQVGAYLGTGVRASAVMAVEGHVDITLADYIRTTGSAVTGLFSDVSQNIGAWAKIVFGVDVSFDRVPSAIETIFTYGQNNDNTIRVRQQTNGNITVEYVVATTVIWTLTWATTTAGNKRFAVHLENGNNAIIADGEVKASNTGVFVPTSYNPVVLGGNATGTDNRLTATWFKEFVSVPFGTIADAEAFAP